MKIELVAPSAPGHYTSYFKLKERGQRRFGQRLPVGSYLIALQNDY